MILPGDWLQPAERDGEDRKPLSLGLRGVGRGGGRGLSAGHVHGDTPAFFPNMILEQPPTSDGQNRQNRVLSVLAALALG